MIGFKLLLCLAPVAATLSLGSAAAFEESAPTCEPNGCVPWQKGGGYGEFTFQRPNLDAPPSSGAEWTNRRPQVKDQDRFSGPDTVNPTETSEDGTTVTAPIENHLGYGLTPKGQPTESIDDGLEGHCIELYAEWEARRQIQRAHTKSVTQSDGSTTYVVTHYTYEWEYYGVRSCVTDVCPYC